MYSMCESRIFWLWSVYHLFQNRCSKYIAVDNKYVIFCYKLSSHNKSLKLTISFLCFHGKSFCLRLHSGRWLGCHWWGRASGTSVHREWLFFLARSKVSRTFEWRLRMGWYWWLTMQYMRYMQIQLITFGRKVSMLRRKHNSS